MAVEPVTGAWSALSKFTGLRSFRTVYWPYFIYGSRTALLHFLASRSDCFLPCCQQNSLNGLECPVTTEKKVDKTA